MKIERVEVTTTPTSIKDLIDTARGSGNVPPKCTVITLKYDVSETAKVQMSDADTENKVTILDNVIEGIGDCSFEDFDISLVRLNTITGTVDVDIIISQGRI